MIEELELKYKPLVIVCDANVFIHYLEIVEEVLQSGELYDLPASVVLPYQVFRELEDKKQNGDPEIAERAGYAIQSINQAQKNPGICYLSLQTSAKHGVKVRPSILFENNDDYILNCALQEKEFYKDERIVILLTADLGLQIAGGMEDLISESPVSIKSWVKRYKESVLKQEMFRRGMIDEKEFSSSLTLLTRGENDHRSLQNESSARQSYPNQTFEMNMEVDSEPELPSGLPSNLLSRPSLTLKPGSLTPASAIKSWINFYLEILNTELLEFLTTVIEDSNERLYEDLKKHASRPRPGWNLVHCMMEVVRRWNTLTDKRLPQCTHNSIKQIIEVAKKINRAIEDLTKSEMSTYFTCVLELVGALKESHTSLAGNFFTRVSELFDEWEQKANSRSISPSEEDEPQLADVALQNIYNCMRSDYKAWKEMAANESDKEATIVSLQTFLEKVNNILQVLKSGLRDYPRETLSVNDQCIYNILKETTAFRSEDGNTLTFSHTAENILALFKENNLRKGVEEMVDNMTGLKADIIDLIDELNGDDDLDF